MQQPVDVLVNTTLTSNNQLLPKPNSFQSQASIPYCLKKRTDERLLMASIHLQLKFLNSQKLLWNKPLMVISQYLFMDFRETASILECCAITSQWRIQIPCFYAQKLMKLVLKVTSVSWDIDWQLRSQNTWMNTVQALAFKKSASSDILQEVSSFELPFPFQKSSAVRCTCS